MKEFTTYKSMRDWPYSLLDDLYSMYPSKPAPDDEQPVDLESSVIYAIGTLSDRTSKMLLMRYAQYMPYSAIAKEFNITQERVRQIVMKGLRQLRHPSRMIFIELGVRGAMIQAKKEAADKARDRAVVEYLATLKLEELEKGTAKGQKNIYATRLDDLCLSARAYNCLRRCGNETVGDVMRLEADELRRVRNLGTKSYCEIIRVFEDIGVDCSKFKEDE